MRTLIALNSKKLFSNYRLYVSVMLIELIALTGLIQSKHNYIFGYGSVGGINLFILGFVKNRAIGLLHPLIAAFPYADTIVKGIDLGEIRRINTASYDKFIISKIIMSLMSGGLIMMGSLFIGLVALCVYDSSPALFISSDFLPLLNNIYSKSMSKAIVLFIINASLSGAIYSFFIMSITTFTRNMTISMTIPVIMNIFMSRMSAIFTMLHCKLGVIISNLLRFDFYSLTGTNAIWYVLQYVLIICISVVILQSGVHKQVQGEIQNEN